jgi:hexosaminidase
MHKSVIILFAAAWIFLSGCGSQDQDTVMDVNLVPLPEAVTVNPGYFQLTNATTVVYYPEDEAMKMNAEFLADMLSKGTGFGIETRAGQSEMPGKNQILLLMENMDVDEEGYLLESGKKSVVVKAPSAAGVFYGVQTLRQLLSPDIETAGAGGTMEWKVPAVEIRDEPRYEYRGLHLDVARHFFPVEFIKRYMDLMALHKLNKFHWHLTEDQGWRIEIDAYPKLAEIAAYRDETLVGHYTDQPHQFDGQRYGGYYTKEEVKEVVDYARTLHIDVIPEIEMPGHSQAALAAYPELGCTGGPYEVATKWGIFEEVYCAGKEETFEFLENVLLEVIDLFPYEYVHIGGDECPKVRWEECPDCQARIKAEGLKDEHELQSYFITRMEKFLNAHDRQIIGWDEILEGGLAPGATVMSWRGVTGGIEAARQGHDVIMTPTSHMYFDYYQAPKEGEPLAIGGLLPLQKVYMFEPTPEVLTVEESEYVLGVQANLWTEYIKTGDYAEYMAYPRACALAEVAWTPKDKRDYADFYQRMKYHVKRLEAMDVNFRPLDAHTEPGPPVQ